MDAYLHRKGAKTICVQHNGVPVKNADIKIRQTRHQFLFGGAVFEAVPFANGESDSGLSDPGLSAPGLSAPGQTDLGRKMDKALELFNFITLPFYWGRFEPERGRPDTERLKKAAEWLKSKGCVVKGHPLCWHTVCAPWLLDMGNREILEAQIGRIGRDVTAFHGLIDCWDVINEVVIMPVFNKYDNGITRICKEYGRIGLAKRVFVEAWQANPTATLLINDFNVSDSYAILLEGLLEAGVPINAIGIQSHMHQGYWGAEKTGEVLARFEGFGLPLHFTEVNMVSGQLMPAHIEDLNDYQVTSWPSDPDGLQRQAEDAAAFYRQLFAHPLVEAVTWWNLTDGGWLNAPAGLLTADGAEKPAYQALHNLIKNEWWTPEQPARTDEHGMTMVTGFKGGYTAEFDGGCMAFEI